MDPYDARCRENQIDECRNAVADHTIQNIASGGVCSPNNYDIYDQLCELNYYTNGIDYCCCAHDKKALCCRFHYDHNYFRCDEEEDTISLPISLTTTIIISVIVSVAVLVLVITIAVKCASARRARRKREGNTSGDGDDKPDTGGTTLEESQQPLNPRAPSSVRREGNNNTHVTFNTEPTAPPAEYDDNIMPRLPPYERVESQPSDMSVPPAALHGPQHELYRSESDNYEERRHQLMQPEPPPAYDQHHDHPLYHPEINNSNRAENWL